MKNWVCGTKSLGYNLKCFYVTMKSGNGDYKALMKKAGGFAS